MRLANVYLTGVTLYSAFHCFEVFYRPNKLVSGLPIVTTEAMALVLLICCLIAWLEPKAAVILGACASTLYLGFALLNDSTESSHVYLSSVRSGGAILLCLLAVVREGEEEARPRRRDRGTLARNTP
jgi:hypothetical protein